MTMPTLMNCAHQESGWCCACVDALDQVHTKKLKDIEETPIEMLLWCPECSERHVDVGEFATKKHHTHACQHCGHVWRPAVSNTVGVRFLPGFKNKIEDEELPW